MEIIISSIRNLVTKNKGNPVEVGVEEERNV
jgi:hypothetical protein